MDTNLKTTESVRFFTRKDVKKNWNENGEKHQHAPKAYRHNLVRRARRKEKHNLANAVANNNLDNYEPLCVAKRDADWLYF
jgi:hypothetical protein